MKRVTQAVFSHTLGRPVLWRVNCDDSDRGFVFSPLCTSTVLYACCGHVEQVNPIATSRPYCHEVASGHDFGQQ
jgi:hypothetical protein